MRLRNNQLKRRLYGAALATLALGLAAALLIYLVADEAPPDAVGYVVAADGTSYPVAPNQSKRYIRDLERFGGKSSVLFDELNRWFASLWRGKSLGITIGWISAIAALALSLFARWLPPDSD
jgi:hypothetical protein